MQKPVVIGVVVVVLLALGTAWLLPHRGATSFDSSSLPPTQFIEKTANSSIVANYASSTPLRGSVGADANTAAIRTMRDFVAQTIADYKSGSDANHQSSLDIVYLISSSKQTVSYIYTVYEDTGGAHANAYFTTFTFDTKSGALLSIGDLFSNSSYLQTLSQIARAKLPSIIDKASLNQSMLNNGTTPDAKNFSAFFIDNNNLDILFAPYAVAPYSAGTETLPIPLGDLSNILKPQYQ